MNFKDFLDMAAYDLMQVFHRQRRFKIKKKRNQDNIIGKFFKMAYEVHYFMSLPET